MGIEKILEMVSSSSKHLIPGTEIFAFFKRKELSNYAISNSLRQIEQVQPDAIIMLTEDSVTSNLNVGRWETKLDDSEDSVSTSPPKFGESLEVAILGTFNKAHFNEV